MTVGKGRGAKTRIGSRGGWGGSPREQDEVGGNLVCQDLDLGMPPSGLAWNHPLTASLFRKRRFKTRALMGIQDRDYYRDALREREGWTAKKRRIYRSREPMPVVVKMLLVMVALIAAAAAWHYFR
ncbi:MAG: hypothetical protein QFE16_04455 [Pseudomonadota bacterium]|nr:hypothetical protein [Pseudomonadota bacterium]